MEALQRIPSVLPKSNEDSEIPSTTIGSTKRSLEKVPDKNLELTAVSSINQVVVVENKTDEVEVVRK